MRGRGWRGTTCGGRVAPAAVGLLLLLQLGLCAVPPLAPGWPPRILCEGSMSWWRRGRRSAWRQASGLRCECEVSPLSAVGG